ncbi:hypothetical protein BC938DRAFT_471456 [Jimgerdemannia flammicorona]|uniref:Uncharacterized protein n=1 Tax=Jimgerdemannia flammicorona TaxID=994334 RepID=A0A433Q7Y9_9FUNG|nr:hypothetical protein BC938DRAFT_471456 [Jimgerdemannia flammicorona]
MTDPTRSSYLAFFTELCNKAHSGDEPSSLAVSLIETATRQADFLLVSDSPDDHTRLLLAGCGVVDGRFLHPDDWPRYMDAKRALRSQWHQQTQRALREELDVLLRSAPGNTYERRSEAVRAFVEQHGKAIGTHPFLHGLARTLRMQLHEATLVAWTFLDDVFIQNGVEIMRAEVGLLITVLGMTHSVAGGGGEDLESDDPTREVVRTWYVGEELADAEIRELLSVLPDDKRLTGRATGDSQVSARERPVEMRPV